MCARLRVPQGPRLVGGDYCAGRFNRSDESVSHYICPALTFPILGADFYHPVIVIPILLLWRVQIKLQQKLALGFSLCLSIIMIITAIVQISGIHAPANTIDVVWEIFWQLMEACIAVIMVSLTAFRSLFVAHGSGAKSPPKKPSLRKRMLNSRIAVGRKRANDSEETERLPEVPRATLTGMRTFIWGKRADANVMNSEGSDDTEGSWPVEDSSADRTIRIEHDMWQKSENVSSALLPCKIPLLLI